MSTLSFKHLVIVAATAMASFTAHAVDTVIGANFVNNTSTYSKTFADGLTATFTSAPGKFQKKSQDGITGVGITGKTTGEIDIGEMVSGSFSKGVMVSSIRLGLLFDGPEYSDVNEVAQITAFWLTGGSTSYTLTANGVHTAAWTGMGTVASVGSGSVNGGTGAWDIYNPFANKLISKLQFTALTGFNDKTCGSNGKSNCTNQSDYTLVSVAVTPVPEPETYALMLAGLGLMGTIVRRRKAKNA